MEKIFLIFVAFFTVIPTTLGLSCPSNNGLFEYIEKMENATQTVITNIQGIVGLPAGISMNNTITGPPNTTTLYLTLTTSLNIVPTAEGLSNFSMALDIITNSYFKSCYGPIEERPIIEDSAAILNEFLSLLNNRTDITRMRQLFGQLSCLQNFSNIESHDNNNRRRKRQLGVDVDLAACANTTSLENLYDCLDKNDSFNCIFNLNDPQNCTNSDNLQPKDKKHCLAFAVDTTGSMSQEISHARQVIQHFIQSEENEVTLCYVLVPFNDYGSPAWPDLGNLDFARIYDANCHSSVDDYCSFTMTDGSPVYGVDILLKDIKSNLTATGGGDCPEYGMTAILKAIDLLDNVSRDKVQTEGRHNLIVLTDASAKDNSLYQDVIDTIDSAVTPDITVHFFYSGSGCEDGFGNYEDIRMATNGLSVNQIDANNFQNFVDFITLSSFNANAQPNGKKKRNSPDSCQYFIISLFTTKFSVLFETTSSSILITKPDNSTETVSTFADSVNAIYKVTNTQAGTWQACVSNSHTLIHTLAATIALELNVDYLKESSDGVLLPTTQLPFACDTHTFTVTSPDLGKISLEQSLFLDIINSDGNALQTTELFECAGYLSGTVTIPRGLVQYQLRGFDSDGTPFTHPIPNSFTTFDVPALQTTLHGTSNTTIILNPGQSSLVRISIRNTKSGPQNLQASAAVNVPLGIQSQFLNGNSVTVLPQQSSNKLLLMLNIPSTIAIGQELNWSINITDTCTNSITVATFKAIVKKSIPLNVIGTSTSTISLEWLPPPIEDGYNITNYTLTLDYANGTIATKAFSSNAKQYIVTGLFPYQQVYASIIAYIDSGETAEISPISILTDELEPGPVYQLMTKPLSSNLVTIQWSLPLQQNGIILYYELSITGFNDTVHNSSTTSVTIAGLEPYIRYAATVKAATSVGKGEPVTVEFYSLEGIPVESPYYTNHTATSPNSLICQWSPPPVEDRKGFITHYDVIIEYMEGRKEYNTNENIVHITGVPDFADLNVSISASTSAGQGPFSKPMMIHITTGVPTAPQNITVTAPSSTSVELSWNGPEYPNGKIIHYQLYYKQVKDNIIQNITIYDGKSYSIQGLKTNEDYHFYVAAVNYAGHGMNSTQVYVSLPSGVNLAAAIVVPVICLILIAIVVTIVGIFVFLYRYKLQDSTNQKQKEEIDLSTNVAYDYDRKRGFVEEKVDFYEEIAQTEK